MKLRFYILLLLVFLASKGMFSQESTAPIVTVTFSGIPEGIISRNDVLNGSLQFSDFIKSSEFKIRGFSLTTKCDSVTRYLENNKDNHLNSAMKEMVKGLKPGCEIEFSNFKIWPSKNSHGSLVMKKALLKYSLE